MVEEAQAIQATFDPALLESCVLALLSVAGLVYLANHFLGRVSPYSSEDDRRAPSSAPPPSPSSSGAAKAPAEQRTRRTDSVASLSRVAIPRPAPPKPAARAIPVPDPPKLTARDKRRHNRRKGKPTKVLLRTSGSEAPPIPCWVVNRSQGGVGLTVREPLAVGTLIAIRAVDANDDLPWVELEVRNCRPQGKKWLVGCQFSASLPWSVLLLFG